LVGYEDRVVLLRDQEAGEGVAQRVQRQLLQIGLAC
jgi:hypothetical protein